MGSIVERFGWVTCTQILVHSTWIFFFQMFSFIFFVLYLTGILCVNKHASQIVKREDATGAFGFTNFHIKLKDKKDRSINNVLKQNSISDVPIQGGPYQIQPWRKIKIPMPLILNERIRNPKFISKNPQRKHEKKKNTHQTKNFGKEIINTKPPHANILNTNYKFAFLARKKNVDGISGQRKNTLKDIGRTNNIDVRLGLRKRKRVLRRRKRRRCKGKF